MSIFYPELREELITQQQAYNVFGLLCTCSTAVSPHEQPVTALSILMARRCWRRPGAIHRRERYLCLRASRPPRPSCASCFVEIAPAEKRFVCGHRIRYELDFILSRKPTSCNAARARSRNVKFTSHDLLQSAHVRPWWKCQSSNRAHGMAKRLARRPILWRALLAKPVASGQRRMTLTKSSVRTRVQSRNLTPNTHKLCIHLRCDALGDILPVTILSCDFLVCAFLIYYRILNSFRGVHVLLQFLGKILKFLKNYFSSEYSAVCEVDRRL